MTKDEALKKALDEMSKMSAHELRAELDKYQNGPLATSLREAGDFLYNHDPDSTPEKEADQV